MEKVRIFYDSFGKTLTVWIGDPATEEVCEEADDDTILIKDASGRVIGFEKLNVELAATAPGLAVELVQSKVGAG